MNQEANNEIDLMLRKLGRQSGNVPAEVDHGMAEEHLDADELNMYAENALPAKARARYTEHLADCSRCRQLVSQLTMAAGVVVEERKAGVPAPSGIKAWLAGFFSPMVLRYVVPTLALVIITSVAFMVFRDSGSKQSANVASRPEQAVAKNEATPGTETFSVNSPNDTTGRVNTVKSPAPQPERAENTATKAGETDAPKETAANKRDESPTSVDQVAAAPPATVGGAVATVSPKRGVDDNKAVEGRDVAEKKRQQAEPSPKDAEVVKVTPAPAKEEQRNIALADAARSNVAKAKSAPAARAKQEREATDNVTAGRRADKDESETRSVAGRKFRREGSTWIDTAYSSQATTNVTRGSEQYRALIADEPSIRTIANQLDGEVIVVWKNRAYKIR